MLQVIPERLDKRICNFGPQCGGIGQACEELDDVLGLADTKISPTLFIALLLGTGLGTYKVLLIIDQTALQPSLGELAQGANVSGDTVSLAQKICVHGAKE